MTVTCTWLTFTACTPTCKTQKEFSSILTEELIIDNTYDKQGERQRHTSQDSTARPTLYPGITNIYNGRREEISTYIEQGLTYSWHNYYENHQNAH
jgi:hypothetical protein